MPEPNASCWCRHPHFVHHGEGSGCAVMGCECTAFQATPPFDPSTLEEPARLGAELYAAMTDQWRSAGLAGLQFRDDYGQLDVVQQAFWCAVASRLTNRVGIVYPDGTNDLGQLVADVPTQVDRATCETIRALQIILQKQGGSLVVPEDELLAPTNLKIKRHPAVEGLVCFEVKEVK